MTPRDEELLDQARNGDQRAFRLLVERYEGKVAATVIGMLGRGPDADDVGQEVFVRLYRSLDKFRGDSSLGTYLTRIAINQSLKTIKRRQSWSRRFLNWEPDLVADRHADDFEEGIGRASLVERALDSLSPDHRAVTVMRLMEGYSTRETAEILDIPEGTVMSRLSRALKNLEVTLGPELELNR